MSRSRAELLGRIDGRAARFTVNSSDTQRGTARKEKEEVSPAGLARQESEIVGFAHKIGGYSVDGFSVETNISSDEVYIALDHELGPHRVPVKFELTKPGQIVEIRPWIVDSDIELSMTPKYGVRSERKYLVDHNGRNKVFSPAINQEDPLATRVNGSAYVESAMSEVDLDRANTGLSLIKARLQQALEQKK